MTPGEIHRLSVALESLRGSMDSGFATVRGDINLLSRGEHSNTQSIEGLEERVGQLESRRFPLHVLGAVTGLATLLLSAAVLVKGG